MKKLYTLFAVAAMAFSANATIYVCGDGNDLLWDPVAPKVVEAANGVYTFTATNCASLKISTSFGDWDTFNAGAVACQIDEATIGTEIALSPADGNIVLPWTGDWTFEIKEDLSTLKPTTTTPKPTEVKIYLRGGMNEWGVVDEWKFSTTDDPTKLVFECDEAHMIGAGVEFKIADGSWGQYNYGTADPIVPDEFGALWQYNGSNAKCESDFIGTIEFYLPEVPQGEALVIFLANAGVGNIAVDNNATKEYYNLQGIRVANPENGLFIVRQGNKVSKVIVK